MNENTNEQIEVDENATEIQEQEITNESRDELKEAIESQFEKLRKQSMLLGAQAMCQVVLKKIIDSEKKTGKKSANDYKRLIKDIKNFCLTGLKNKIGPDGEPVKEDNKTVQN